MKDQIRKDIHYIIMCIITFLAINVLIIVLWSISTKSEPKQKMPPAQITTEAADEEATASAGATTEAATKAATKAEEIGMAGDYYRLTEVNDLAVNTATVKNMLGDFNFAIGLAKNNVLYLFSNSEYTKGSYDDTNLTFGSVTAPYTIKDGKLIVTYKGNKYTLTYTDDRLPAGMTEMDALTKSIIGRLAGEELQ